MHRPQRAAFYLILFYTCFYVKSHVKSVLLLLCFGCKRLCSFRQTIVFLLLILRKKNLLDIYIYIVSIYIRELIYTCATCFQIQLGQFAMLLFSRNFNFNIVVSFDHIFLFTFELFDGRFYVYHHQSHNYWIITSTSLTYYLPPITLYNYGRRRKPHIHMPHCVIFILC